LATRDVGCGEGVEDLPEPGNLERGQPLARPHPQLFAVDAEVGCRDHEDLDLVLCQL
jgi:hypothetical protein